MDRRTLLRLTTAGVLLTPVSGCIEQFGPSNDSRSVSDPVALDSIEPPSLDDDCGQAELPLSALLVESGTCQPHRFDAERPVSLVLENEREESIQVTIEVASSDGNKVLAESYTLDPDERIVESSNIDANEDHTVSVAVEGDDEPVEGSWDGIACNRHGIAVTPKGIAIGYMDLGYYGCYPGADSRLGIFTDDAGYTVTAQIQDLCSGDEAETTLELEHEDGVWVDELLTVGGVFEVTVDVHNGETEAEVFRDLCPNLSANIDGDGNVELGSGGFD